MEKAAFQQPVQHRKYEGEPDDVSVDHHALLAITDKLLAVNRGQAEPDERDSLEFRRIHTPDKLLAERINLDAGNVRRVAMRRLAKQRNLKPIGPGHFDPYVSSLLIGNPLTSPLEEINPLHLVEQSRRITQMGPGGIPSDESITQDSQNVHPSIFGFLSAIEAPESSRAGVDTRLAWGAKIGSDGKIYQKMLNRRTGKHQYVSPDDLANKTVGLPD
jgi:DNA-directed RNA polymerase beta subunit